ncbi:AraC family transcriptional regulator ligand-binding domain-containing protein [Rhodococcus pseudokoreensis]|uniref:AraC family transcriptional regulator ligand-binding domain-containing protein n=1 Tax=Rhodococcus pseudokoreensis TaxID=2811421 RepID=UPI001F127A6C|nr:AraC family transcriptional regulator ligand-binding domain-containing protein [Rhodococcus pseudokoreensis]
MDPLALIRSAGLDPLALVNPDGWISAVAVDHLLEASAAAAACESFGLRLAETRQLSHFGALSLVAQEEPDVRSAVSVLLLHGDLHNEAVHSRLVEAHGLATVRVAGTEIALGRQSTELAVAVLVQILRNFLKPDWQPVSVCFTHDSPSGLEVHQRVLGDSVVFNHTFNGIVLYSDQLDAENPMSDPSLRPYAQQYLESISRRSHPTITGQVRKAIETLLPTGRCSINYVAQSLSLDQRTLQRRLAHSNETFAGIRNSVRVELAECYVRNREHSLTWVAEELGFSSLSSFSRWFRGEFGHGPRAWSAAGMRPPPPAPKLSRRGG